MSLLRAVAEHFVAPADEAARPAPRAPVAAVSGVPPAVGLLCEPRHARAAGRAVGLHLAKRRKAQAALVAVWTVDGGAATMSGATPLGGEARRLVRALAGRDIAAHASGRVVTAALPHDADAAAQVAAQGFAVAASLPTVLVIAGPREQPLDELLCTRDLVLVVDGGDDLLADTALAALHRRGVAARRCALPASAVASRGGSLLPSARRGLDTAMEGLA